MKRVLSIILIAVFVFSLSACAGDAKITADEALEIALEEAGLSSDDVRNVENRLERDDGVLIYEIDFDAGDTEYSYDVDARTGAIVDRDRDRDRFD